MRYLSDCSGIEAATVAWHELGWEAAAFSEIDPFARAVLAHHYPHVPLHGDFTTIKGTEYGAVDLLVGGTPCQSYSVAGLRKGLADPRGNLMLEHGALAKRLGAKWLVWENVTGVLSSNGGRDFGAFLGMLVELGYGFAYRVLDAQYFGLAQRRKRVFVVACIGDWRAAAAVLFERHSLQRNTAPSREACKGFAGRAPDGSYIGGWPHDVEGTLDAQYGDKLGLENQHIFNQRASRFVPATQVLAFNSNAQPDEMRFDPHVTASLTCSQSSGVMYGDAVRRLTPRECERLQGFPDDYTRIPLRNKKGKLTGKFAKDGPRYKALGNSMAVPCMRWIGERIAAVEAIHALQKAAA